MYTYIYIYYDSLLPSFLPSCIIIYDHPHFIYVCINCCGDGSTPKSPALDNIPTQTIDSLNLGMFTKFDSRKKMAVNLHTWW